MLRLTRAVTRRITGFVPVCLILLAACGSDSTTGPRVSSVTVTAATQSVAAGQTLQLAATARDGDGNIMSGQQTTWSSATQTVATVSASGLVQALSAGTSVITATVSGHSDNITITVTPPPVASIVITPAAPQIDAGETVQLTATPRDAGGTALTGRTITWSSGNDGIATVSATGLVTGVASGVVEITAASEGIDASVDVTVVAPPADIASITITPADPSVQVAATVQLTATPRDAGGNALTGRTIAWSTANGGIATVGATGLVAGVSTGTVEITAASEGIEASVDVEVTAADPGPSVEVTGVTPALLIEGGAATITGSGFGATPAANTVRVDGVVASVTAASATSLTITVPSFDCQPARDATVRVIVGSDSAGVEHPVRPPAFTDAPLGELVLLSDSDDFCIQFDAAAGATSYLIGVQSVSETPGSRTPVRVSGRADVAGGRIITSSVRSATTAGTVDPVRAAGAARRTRHRDAEIDHRRRDHALASALFANAAAARSGAGTARMSNAIVPGNVNLGDTVSVRVPGDDLCADFTTIDAIVRAKGTRSIWIEDVGNPAGGFTPADYTSLSAMMDDEIWTSNTTYLGTPTDDDANSRVVIVVTKEVNDTDNLLGFVSSADFYPGQCPAANGGEYYYGRAPDPSGTAGAAYATEDALHDAPSLIAHEFAHIIQVGRRIYTQGATTLASVWEMEGQATFAEEVAGHAFTGNTTGQNYGFATAWNAAGTPPISWYQTSFVDLALWYGFEDAEGKVGNAPEQCGWLGRPSDADALGPCIGSRSLYGVSWSFLRWLSDQYGPGYPGGEAALHRALVVDTDAGFETITKVTGEPIDDLLAHWAASLYVDDRFAGMDSNLQFTSWNLTAISNGLVASAHLAPRARAFSAFTDNVTVIAGSTAYFTLSGTSRSATALSVRTQTDIPLPASMRLWIVRTQ